MLSRGFTLLEILIVLFIVLLVTSLATGNYLDLYRSSFVSSEAEQLVSLLRLARSKSVTEESDTRHQVAISQTSFSLQTGSGVVSESHQIDPRVTVTTASPQIVFEKITGESTACNPCTVTLDYESLTTFTKTVSVSAQGVITSD